MRTPPEELERARSNCSIQRTGKLDSNRKRTKKKKKKKKERKDKQ